MNRTSDPLPVYGEYDVIVSGGGLIGTTCAVALARSGQRVALVERRSALGWELVRARKVWSGQSGEQTAPVSSGFLTALSHAARLGSERGGGFNAPAVELELDRWVMDAGVDAMFHGWSRNITESGGRVDGLVVGTREGYTRLLAPLVVETDDSGRLIDADIPRLAVSGPIWRSCLLHDASLSGIRVIERENGCRISLRPLSENLCRADISLKGEDLQSRDMEFHAALPDALRLVRAVGGCETAKLHYLAEEEWSQPGFRLSAEALPNGGASAEQASEQVSEQVPEQTANRNAEAETVFGQLLRGAPHSPERTLGLTARHIAVSRNKGLVLGGPWLPCYLDASAGNEEAEVINRVLLGEAIAAYARQSVLFASNRSGQPV